MIVQYKDNDALYLKLWFRKLAYDAYNCGEVHVPGWLLSATKDMPITRQKITERAVELTDTLSTPLDDCNLYVRVFNLLERNNCRYRTLGDLARATDAELLAIPGFGGKTLAHVRKVIAEATAAPPLPSYKGFMER